MIPELLITCPRCKQPNFTPRGLRAHRCPSIITGGKARPLPKDEVAYAVAAADAARKKAAAFPNEQSSQGSTESHPAKTTEAKLELVTQADAETEKLIDANVKTMRLAVGGHLRSESLLYAYAAICGAAANRLADLIPARGGLEKLLKEKFPGLSKSQLHVWRNLARDIAPHITDKSYSGLITAPIIGAKISIPAKKLEGFQDAVKTVLKGATMVEFHKQSQFCGDVADAGGDRGGSKGEKISDADAAELLRESMRANARDAAALMEDQQALVRLMDDMTEFGKIRMIYHDLNQMMLDMEKKANIAAGDKRAAL